MQKVVDFLTVRYYIYCTGNKSGGENVSPRTGRPVKDDAEKKNVRLEIRLTDEENMLLTELSEYLQISKTATIIKALRLLEQQSK